MSDPNPTTGVGEAVAVTLTGTGVLPVWPIVPGKRGISQFAVSVPIGGFVEVTALPIDVAGTIVPNTNIGTPGVPAVPGTPATPQNIHLGTSLPNYAILAYSAVTGSSGAGSVVSGGNVGLYPTALTGVTNFPPSSVTPPNVILAADPASLQAQTDLTAAITYWGTTYVSPGGSHVVAGDNLSTNTSGGSAGVYYAGIYTGGALDAPTSITLDAQGNAQAVFVFISSSTTKFESGASVILANGAQAGNVYWVVGSSFTSVWNGVQSNMVGNILASSSVTLGGGNLNGRALASTGAVTLATTEIITWPALSLIPGTPGTPAVPGIPAVQQVTNVVTYNTSPSSPGSPAWSRPAWYRPSNFGKYDNTYMCPVTVDDNDSNPWIVRGRSAGQVVVEFQMPSFLNAEGASLIDTQAEMDETPIDMIYAHLVVTVTGGTS